MRILDFFKNPGSYSKPYIIAEAGVNHEGKMDLAKRLIDEAKEGGSDAIKFQTYKAHLIASKNSPSYWDTKKESTKSQYELFKKYDNFWKKEYEDLKIYCDKADIEFLSTPFDLESSNFLNDIIDAVKISSSDITNKPFIEHLCKFNKPIILSTGAANLQEIREAVSWIDEFGNDLSLLHCVLNYPTNYENANLGMIYGLKKAFPSKIIGYSDHTFPGDMSILETAFLLGARIIEKHFTFDKNIPGNDHYHSMDKEDLKIFIQKLDQKIKYIGKTNVDYIPSEELSRLNARRSLVALKDIPEGKIIDKFDLTWKRPGIGVSPKFIENVIGKKAKKNIQIDEIIKNDFYE